MAEPIPGEDGELAELSKSLSAMASVVLGEETLDAVLDLVVSLAESTLPGVVGSSVSLLRTQGFETANASSELVRDLDAEQYKEGQGPCVEAIRSGTAQRLLVADLANPWPTFASRARGAGIQAVLSVPLRSRGQTNGALNLYASDADILDPPAARLAQRFADHAGAVVANAAAFAASELVNENLMRALESRQIIGQATGILMARQNCRAEEAFDMLRRASQRSNRKLREVAEELVRSNDPPTGGGVAS